MDPTVRMVGRYAMVMLCGAMSANAAWAGDFKEARQEVPTAGAKIFHRVWLPSAFPLKWRLHEAGVVNNRVRPPVTNEMARRALEAGFQQWADVQTANIRVEFAGETTTAEAACDLENIVTWSDQASFPAGSRKIARGITSVYAGPAITLDDANRMGVCCSAGMSRPGLEKVDLPKNVYPNGTRLETGTILDMDMVWNSRDYDFVTEPGTTPNVLDIQALATHEFGHLLGLTHSSMLSDLHVHGANTPTMTVKPIPKPGTPDRKFQEEMRSLDRDDRAAAGRAYPGHGFFPGGTAPFVTGAIKGRVTTENGAAVEGARVWLFDAALNPVWPLYETFTATAADFELAAGDFQFEGILPGRYFVCIQPWRNRFPDKTNAAPSEDTYNWSVELSRHSTDFKTECFDDIATGGTTGPRFGKSARMRAVSVVAGTTAEPIDISVKPR